MTMVYVNYRRVANVGSRPSSRLAGNAARCAMAAEKYPLCWCGVFVQLEKGRLTLRRYFWGLGDRTSGVGR